MNNNEIMQNLNCFIDLSLFDANTGENIYKELLDKEAQRQVTACEEAMHFLCGVPASELAMPKQEIIDVLQSLAADFEKGVAEAEANGVDKSLEHSNIEAFKAMSEILETEQIPVFPVEDLGDKEVTAFDCEKDLSKYTDSLLFPSGECVATMTVEDEKGHELSMELIVTGDVRVEFEGETYRSPDDFPPALVQAIKDGKYDEAFTAEDNNWFELVYTLTDSRGNELAYDGDVWEESLHNKTPEQLKASMAEAGIQFMEHHIGKEPDEPEV